MDCLIAGPRSFSENGITHSKYKVTMSMYYNVFYEYDSTVRVHFCYVYGALMSSWRYQC